MNTEILSVGTELLLGEIANTDAQMISEGLSQLGINVYYHTVVGDNPERLRQAVEIAKGRADIIITTGGLGPTYDDLTKEILAECFGKKLVRDPEAYDRLMGFFEKRGVGVMTENNLKQADLPEGCVVLQNDWGTAPGCAFCEGGVHVIMLPGPPRECRPMFYERAVPYLIQHVESSVILSHSIKTFNIGESKMESMLYELMTTMRNPTVAPYAKTGECLARVTAKAGSKKEAEQMLKPVIAQVCEILGDVVYGVDIESLERLVVDELIARGMTISAAESCTGGVLSKRITDIPGSSACFAGGVCTYSNEIKERILGVSQETLLKHGAVSEETAREMAALVKERFITDVGVGITGIAGPGGGSEEKPVGLVYVAVSYRDAVYTRKLSLFSDREGNRNMAASHALDIIRIEVLHI